MLMAFEVSLGWRELLRRTVRETYDDDCLNLAAQLAYYWITPGAVVATVLWIVVSLGFKFNIATFTDYNAAYGAVGGVIALMLWFYISGLAILVGAEINSELEHASRHGKAPGEKFPGARKELGTAAARAYKKELMERPHRVSQTREGVAPIVAQGGRTDHASSR